MTKQNKPPVPYKIDALLQDKRDGNTVVLSSVQGVQYKGVIRDILPRPGQDYLVKLAVVPIGVKDVLVRAG